ncbi:hypothetical protein SBBP2_650019 [Burkholderiales bacterium]|nr:hypothetical protein SBBP2_650019 [Burkholderiales bacterium]
MKFAPNLAEVLRTSDRFVDLRQEVVTYLRSKSPRRELQITPALHRSKYLRTVRTLESALIIVFAIVERQAASIMGRNVALPKCIPARSRTRRIASFGECKILLTRTQGYGYVEIESR